MKAALFTLVPYMGPAPQSTWPVPVQGYATEAAQQSMRFAMEQWELADQVGFDWVTVAEHHYSPMSLTPNPMITAGALAAKVKRAKVALLGADVPILNPVRVAEEFAMLDTMTGGKVVAGMLRGTSNEYVTYNINPAESRERFEEAIDLIIHAWTEPQPFGWQGRFYEYRTISIWPRPVQTPHPPIYISGSSPESAEMAARRHLKLGFAFTTVPRAAKAAAYFREQTHAQGWEPEPDDILYRATVYVADTDDQAMEDLLSSGAGTRRGSFATSNRVLDDTAARAGYYGRDTEEQRARLATLDLDTRIEEGQLLAGSPDKVLKQLAWVRDQLGAGIVDLMFAPVGRDKVLKSIELFGTKVLPRMGEI
jgi:alkanesulfonate monooxygenase SsuD/methylene tetrahydromethanopterin reductase-like flavin-dependent oxidoreductase (luciferase family)